MPMLVLNADTGVSKVQPDTIGSAEIVDAGIQSADLAQKMTLMTAQNSTSGTAIDFTGIPSWAKRITVMFNGVSTNGTSSILIQLGNSGGIEITSYFGGGFNTAGTVLGSNLFTTGFGISSNLATQNKNGAITISNMYLNTWVASGSVSDSTDTRVVVLSGSKTLSATLDRIRITTVNGTDTFDAGSINVMYEG